MPCTFGGAPVTIDMLFGFVNVGIAASAMAKKPSDMILAMLGNNPANTPCEMYRGSQPS